MTDEPRATPPPLPPPLPAPAPQPVPSSVRPAVPAAVPSSAPPRAPRRTPGRLLRTGLLAAAVAAVVALDTGAVPLPFSTPVALPDRVSQGSQGGTDPDDADADLSAGERARNDGIEAATAAMTAAYTAKDEAAFLALVDPVDTKLVTRMRTMFRNLRAIGYDQVAFGWPDRQTYPLPAGKSYDAPGASAEAVAAAVEVRTRISSFDRKTASTVLGLSFADRGGRWLVVGDKDAAEELDLYTASEPWMLGTVYVAKKAHTIVVGEAKRKRDVDRLAAQVEQAIGAVRAVWKVKSWNGKAVVYATTDRRFVDSQFGGRDAKSNKVTKEAVFDAKVEMLYATPVLDLADIPEEATPRMVVTPFLLGRNTAQSRAVLRHELTHVAFAYEGGESVPTWLVEGIAEYTAFRTGGSAVDGVGALAARGLPRTTWTEIKRGTWKPSLVADPGDFYSGTSKHVSDTYTTGWLTCLHIADSYGEQSLARLYAAAGARSPDEDPEAVEAAILKKVLKTKRSTLVSETKSYARRIRSRFV
ncbi:hypothetical protein [Kineosporia sp. A_224]|uniref:hypothetical protein n=1 Tax=Kineosporia sp. A_224 TaxID=1962180 RepID=UPI000B4A79F6|nr:hypothetical protein [Kineosporia sp. A_224]